MFTVGPRNGFWRYVSPSPRFAHAMVCFQDTLLYVIGGCEGAESYLNDVHIFDLIRHRWYQPPLAANSTSPLAASDPTPNNLSAMNNMSQFPALPPLATGSLPPNNSSQPTANSSVGMPLPHSTSSTVLASNTPSTSHSPNSMIVHKPLGRAFHTAVILGEVIYVFGGKTHDGDSDELWLFHLSAGWHRPKLSAASEPGPCPRSGHCSCVIGRDLYVFGGDIPRDAHDMFVLNTEALTWTAVNVSGPRPKCVGQTACVIDNKIYVFGSPADNPKEKCSLMSKIYIFDPVICTWQAIDIRGRVPSPRKNYSLSVLGKTICLLGGVNQNDIPLFDLWCIAIQNTRPLEWTVPDVEGVAPCARSLHASVGARGCLFVFGGTDDDNSQQSVFNDLHILNIRPNPAPGTASSESSATNDKSQQLQQPRSEWRRWGASPVLVTPSPTRSAHTPEDDARQQQTEAAARELAMMIADLVDFRSKVEDFQTRIRSFTQLNGLPHPPTSAPAYQRASVNPSPSQSTVADTKSPPTAGDSSSVYNFASGPTHSVSVPAPSSASTVILNVGGHVFHTSLRTLTAGAGGRHMLAAAFVGPWHCFSDSTTTTNNNNNHNSTSVTSYNNSNNGNNNISSDAPSSSRSSKSTSSGGPGGPRTFFIDRDGTHFRLILNYLRDGNVVLPPNPLERRELLLEAMFYGLDSLVALIEQSG